MKYKNILLAIAFATIPFLSACSTTNYSLNEERMTVAKAQREIKIGMTSSAVIEALGSPNMVTTDTGWKISLDRGLDIYQTCERKDFFAFTTRLQKYRPCKPFEITYIKQD